MTLCGSLGAACGSTSVVETTEPSEGDRAEYRQQAADEINDVNALDKSSELEREIDSDDE